MRTGYLALFLILFVLLLTFAMGNGFRLYPASTETQLSIYTRYANLAAEEIDQVLTQPISIAVRSLPGVKKVNSISSRGTSRIYITLFPGTDPARFQLLLSYSLQSMEAQLPPAANTPRIAAGSSDSIPIFTAVFPSSEGNTAGEFAEIARGIPQVEKAVFPEHKFNKLVYSISSGEAASSGLRLRSTIFLLQDLSWRAPALSFSRSASKALLIFQPPEFELYQKGKSNRAAVHMPQSLQEVGELQAKSDYSMSINRLNGTTAHVVHVYASRRSGIIELCSELEELMRSFPEGTVLFNRGAYLKTVFRATAVTVGIGVLSVFILLLLQMGVRHHGLTAVFMSLPAALLSGLFLLRLAGLDIDLMSLSGIAVSSGLLIDTLVLYYEESLYKGPGPAVREMRPTILISTGTTLLSFIPVLLLPARLRGNFLGFMLVTSVTLTIGSLWTLLVLPKILPFYGIHAELHVAVHRRYLHLLQYSRAVRAHPVITVLLFFALFGFSGIFISISDFLPYTVPKTGSLSIRAEFPDGTKADHIDAALAPLFCKIRQLSDVDALITSSSNGQAQFHALISSEDVRNQVNRLIQAYKPPGNVSFISDELASGEEGFEIRLYGPEPAVLRQQIIALGQLLSETTNGIEIFFDFKSDSTAYELYPDLPRLNSISFTPRSMVEEFAQYVRDSPIAKAKYGDEKDILIRPLAPPLDFKNFIRELQISSPGTTAHLQELIDIRSVPGIAKIKRENGALYSSITLAVPEDYGHAHYIGEVQRLLSHHPVPVGYQIEIAPEFRRRRRESLQIGMSLVLGMILILMILFSYYKKIGQSILAFLHIPPAVFAAALCLSLFKQPVTIPVLGGFMILIGISINHIVILMPPDYSLQARELSYLFAEKLPSISASTLTTIAGIAPLLIGGAAKSGLPVGLSIVIVSGSLFSFLILFLSVGIIEGYRDGLET